MIKKIINQAKEIYPVMSKLSDKRISQELSLYKKIGSGIEWHKVEKAEIMGFAMADRAGFDGSANRRDKMDIFAAMHYIMSEFVKARGANHKSEDDIRAMNFYEGARLADNFDIF